MSDELARQGVALNLSVSGFLPRSDRAGEEESAPPLSPLAEGDAVEANARDRERFIAEPIRGGLLLSRRGDSIRREKLGLGDLG